MPTDRIVPRTLDVRGESATIRVFFSQGTLQFTARPLTFSEIQSVILQARNTGWFGNGQVIDAVVQAGLDADASQIESARRDIHLLANTARYVWVLTLHRLAQFTNRVGRLLGLPAQVHARFYRYADLATPALVHFLKEKASSVDVEKYFDSFFKHVIASARFGTQILSRRELRQRLRDQREQIAVGFLRAMIGEQRPFDALPASIFSSVAERFFCFGQLMSTLDWLQLRRILESFNIAANVLVFRSNQLGGLTTAPEEARLVTGMPAIWDLLRVRVPAEVSVAVIRDAAKGDLRKVPAPYRRVVHGAYREGLRELREHALSMGKKPPNAEIIRRVVTGFERDIGPRARMGMSQNLLNS